MKAKILVTVISTLLLAACNYRVFDLSEFPELQGSIPGENIGSKITESNFESIFLTVVQPKCIGCHKPGGRAEAIPMTNYQEVLNGLTEIGESLIVPGKPEESLFYTVMLPTAKRIMPPKRSGLGDVEVERTEAVKAWILGGALEHETKQD